MQPQESFAKFGDSAAISSDYDIYIHSKTGAPSAIEKQYSSLFAGQSASRPCFLLLPMSKNSEAINRMQQHYQFLKINLVTEPVDAFVIYYSVHNGKEVKVRFPAVGVFMLSTEPECRKLYHPD